MTNVRALVPIRERRVRAAESTATVNWPIRELSPSSPDEWLYEAIDGQPHEQSARSLWDHYPNLRSATQRFGSFVTPMWPNEMGRSLLAYAIRDAVSKVDLAVRRGETFEGRVIGLYLYWLANSVRDIARVDVYGVDEEGTTLKWQYFSVPLHEWAQSNEFTHLEAMLRSEPPSEEEIAGLRTHLVARITDSHVDAGYLELFAHRG